MKKKQFSRRRGFTLIEVVTTLFIIGLLVVLIYPNEIGRASCRERV